MTVGVCIEYQYVFCVSVVVINISQVLETIKTSNKYYNFKLYKYNNMSYTYSFNNNNSVFDIEFS